MGAMKNGFMTSEFLLTMLAMLVAGLTAANVFAPSSPWAQALAAVSAALASAGYGWSRAQVKGAEHLRAAAEAHANPQARRDQGNPPAPRD